MIHDGLWCAFECWHMGMTGEAVAKKFGVSRIEQDAYSVASHKRRSRPTPPARSRTRSCR